jgi:uncharacterized protein (TIGR01777 family)
MPKRRVLVTGGTGFIGGAMTRALVERGEKVTVLSRDPRRGQRELPREVRVAAWTPEKPGPWYDELGVVEAVIHLAGAPVVGRWSDAYKKKIEESRVLSTRNLVEAIGRAKTKPSVLVSASAAGFYGADREGEVDEDSEPGKDFLAKVCRAWEEEAAKVEEHGVRCVRLRIGVVLGPGGGALAKMVLPLRIGVGAIGKGDNHVSWVHLDDVVGMAMFALDDERVSGPMNATSPYPTTLRELARTAASVIGRPTFPVPLAAVRATMGEAATVLTGSQQVYPRRAVDLEYEFHHARLLPALEASLMAEAS